MERTRVAEVQAMDSRYDTGTREAPMHSWEMSARHEPWLHMGVSKNRGTPKSSIFNRVFHYKPSKFGVSLFLETPIYAIVNKNQTWR